MVLKEIIVCLVIPVLIFMSYGFLWLGFCRDKSPVDDIHLAEHDRAILQPEHGRRGLRGLRLCSSPVHRETDQERGDEMEEGKIVDFFKQMKIRIAFNL